MSNIWIECKPVEFGHNRNSLAVVVDNKVIHLPYRFVLDVDREEDTGELCGVKIPKWLAIDRHIDV